MSGHEGPTLLGGRFEGGAFAASFKTRAISVNSVSLNSSLNRKRGAYLQYMRPARVGATAQKSRPEDSNNTKWSKVITGPSISPTECFLAPMPTQLILRLIPCAVGSPLMPPIPIYTNALSPPNTCPLTKTTTPPSPPAVPPYWTTHKPSIMAEALSSKAYQRIR